MNRVLGQRLAVPVLLVVTLVIPACQRREQLERQAAAERSELMSESERLRSAGDVAGAEAALRRVIEVSPDHAPAHRALGELAADRRSPSEASEHFGRCAALVPGDVECRYGLGLALAELGELDRAAIEIGATAEILDQADVWAELGQLERRRRRLDAAIDAFARGLGRDRYHLPSLLGLGQMLVATGHAEIGEELLERHREEAAFEDHLKAFRRAAADPEADVEVLLQLAQMYRQREDSEQEEATLRKALARAPDSPQAILVLANYLLHQGETHESEQLVAGLGPEMASHPATLFLRGTIALARGAQDEASRHFDTSLASGDWPPLVYVDAGKAWATAGVPERAAEAFRRAIAGAPEAVQAHLGLAESQRALGLSEDALQAVHRVLEIDPKERTALLLRAVLELELGRPERARDAFESALDRRRLELLPAGGADNLRRDLDRLAPPPAAASLFEEELERYRTERL